MPFIDELRKQFPEFSAYSDADLVQAAAPAFGSVDEASSYLGVKRNQPGFQSSIRSGLASHAVGLGRRIEDHTPLTGVGRGLRHFGEDVQFRNPSSVNSFEDFAESPWQGIKQFAGNTIGSVGPSVIPYVGWAGRALGAGRATAASAALSSNPAYAEIRGIQDQQGINDPAGAELGAWASAGIEQVGGIQRALRPRPNARQLASGATTAEVAEFGRSPFRTGAKRLGIISGQEGLEEIGQQPIHQYFGGADPLTPENLTDTAFSGFAGALGTAATFGLGSGLRRGLQHRAARDFASQTLADPNAPFRMSLDAAEIQRQALTHEVGPDAAQQWFDTTMRDVYAREQERMSSSVQPYDIIGAQRTLDSLGADNGELFDQPINPYDVAGRVTAFQEGADTTINSPQGGLFGGGGFAQPDMRAPGPQNFQPLHDGDLPLQGLPHSAPVMPVGAEVEPPVSRAASIYRALHDQVPVPGSQEESDFRWADQVLRSSLAPAQFEQFRQELIAAPLPRGERVPKAGTVVPKVGGSAGAMAPGKTPAATGFGEDFRAAGGYSTQLRTALNAVKTPEEAAEILRATLEKRNIASNTIKAAEALHKKITGETYEAYKRRQESANALAANEPAAARPVENTTAFLQPGESNVVRETVLPGTGQQKAGAESGTQVRVEEAPQRQREAAAGSQVQSAEVIPKDDPAELRQWVLRKIAGKDPRKAKALALHLGWDDGNAIDNTEIGKRLGGIGKERARQLVEDAKGLFTDVVHEHRIRMEQFQDTEEETNDDLPAGPISSFNKVVDAADLAPSSQADGGDQQIDGFSTRPMREINSDNLLGEATVKDDGSLGATKPTGDARANDTVKALEKAAETGDTDTEAIETWDAYSHVQTGEGERIKPWAELSKTERGQQTQKDWLAFFKKSKNMPKPDHAQLRELRKTIKDTYFTSMGFVKTQDEVGELNPYPATDPVVLRAVMKWYQAGFGSRLESRLEGFAVSTKSDGWAAMVVRTAGFDKAIIVVSPQWVSNSFGVTDAELERAIHHELHHVIDEALFRERGRYSADVQLSPAGRVRREIYQHMDDPHVAWLFDYPLRLTDKIPPELLRKELHAQILSAWNVPALRRVLREKLPLTYAYAEKKYDEIKADNQADTKTKNALPEGVQAGDGDSGRTGRVASSVRGERGGASRTNETTVPRTGASPDRLASRPAEGNKFGLMSDAELESATQLLREKIAGFAAATQEISADDYAKTGDQLRSALLELQRRNTARQREDAGLPPKLTKLHTYFPATAYPEEVRPAVSLINAAVKDTVTNWAKKGLNAVVFAHDLADIAVKEGLTTARNFFELLNQKNAIRVRLEGDVERIMDRAAQLHDRQAVNDFLRNSTRMQRWGFQPTWRDTVDIDPVLQASYQRLSVDGKSIVDAVLKNGQETYAQLQRLINAEIDDEFAARHARAKSDAEKAAVDLEHKQQLRTFGRHLPKLKGPYAPLKRFGDYVSVAKSQAYLDAEQNNDAAALAELQQDGNHYVVEFADTLWEAKARSRELVSHFAQTDAFERQKLYKQIQELPWGAIAKVRSAVAGMPDDSAHKEAMSRLLTDVYLTMLSESSARKSELKRRYVQGEDRDMLRAFASKGRATAHFIAALEKNSEVQQTLTDMQNEASRGSQGIREDRSRVFNEIAARYAQSVDFRPTPIADKLMRIASIWQLLLSPSYYLQNLTQPWMLTLPLLSARYGAGSGWSALAKAYQDVGRFTKNMGHTLDIEKLPLSASDKAMLHHMRDHGKLDLTITHDLGRWTEGESVFDKGVFGKVMQKVRTAPQQVEMLNRVTSALAAFRLSGGSLAYTAKVLDQTHGNYGAANAPRAFNANALAKVMLQYRKFALIQISLLGRLLHDAFKNASPEERLVARRALMWIAAHHMVMAGALGLPAANIGSLLLAIAFGDDDEPKDAERMLREAIDDKFVADLLLKGVPAALGMDVSSRVGMGNAFALLPFADYSKLLERKTFGEVVVQALGPFMGLAQRWAEGIGYMSKGDFYKGIEATLPRGLQDSMKAYRFATEGVTQKNSDTVMSAEELTMFDVMSQAVGLPSTTLTDRQRRAGDLYEFRDYFKERLSEIKHRYVVAHKENDNAKLSELREEWSKIGESARRNGFKPSPLSNLLKAPQEQKKREGATVGGVQGRKTEKRFLEAQRDL